MITRPSVGADLSSVLALNPRNREASIARRERLLFAFDNLPEDDQADLLEAAESMAGTGTAGSDFELARQLLQVIYKRAGLA